VTESQPVRTPLRQAHRGAPLVDGGSYLWEAFENNTHVMAAVHDPDLVLYVEPICTPSMIGAALVDAAGKRYTCAVQWTGTPAPAPVGTGDEFVDWLLAQVAIDERENNLPGRYYDEPGYWTPERVQAECDTRRQIITTCADMLHEHESGPDTVAAATLRRYGLLYQSLGRTGLREEWLR